MIAGWKRICQFHDPFMAGMVYQHLQAEEIPCVMHDLHTLQAAPGMVYATGGATLWVPEDLAEKVIQILQAIPDLQLILPENN